MKVSDRMLLVHHTAISYPTVTKWDRGHQIIRSHKLFLDVTAKKLGLVPIFQEAAKEQAQTKGA